MVWHLCHVMETCTSPASAYVSEMIDLATVHTLLPIGWALSWWMVGTAIIAAPFQGHLGTCLHISLILLESPFHYPYLIKLFCLC